MVGITEHNNKKYNDNSQVYLIMSVSETRYISGQIQGNHERLGEIRILSSLFSGLTAGILGLTGIYGFLFLILSSGLTGALILQFSCKGNAKFYFPNGRNEFFSIGHFLSGAMTYILAWTLAYDAIHLF